MIATKQVFKIAVAIFLMTCSEFATSQGCSDAGFCTLNSFKPNTSDSLKETKNRFKIGVSYGNADNAISVYGSYIEYNRQLSKGFGIDTRLTALTQIGNGISATGLSDFFVTANYKAGKATTLTFGAKLPLSNGNKKKNNLPLPLDYQSSLGTFDVIFGIGYEIKKLQLALALQQPLSQNDNQFFAESEPANSALRKIQSTNKFRRSGDVLFRLSYPLALNKKWKLTPSLLPIEHLANDKFTDMRGIEKVIEGSQGLTLNGTVYLDYEVNRTSAFQLNAGAPLVSRDTRPDGLTRHFVANVEYRVKF